MPKSRGKIERKFVLENPNQIIENLKRFFNERGYKLYKYRMKDKGDKFERNLIFTKHKKLATIGYFDITISGKVGREAKLKVEYIVRDTSELDEILPAFDNISSFLTRTAQPSAQVTIPQRVTVTVKAEVSIAKICPKCGRVIENANAKFCPYCGAPLQ